MTFTGAAGAPTTTDRIALAPTMWRPKGPGLFCTSLVRSPRERERRRKLLQSPTFQYACLTKTGHTVVARCDGRAGRPGRLTLPLTAQRDMNGATIQEGWE